MRRREAMVIAAAAVGGAVVGAGALYVANPERVEMAVPTRPQVAAGAIRGELLSLNAPAGTLATEQNASYKAPVAPATVTPAVATNADWPSYNKTLTSERFADLSQINTGNAGKLKVLCTYDSHQFGSFESGLIMVNGALIGTTEFDTFSINPATCALNWRVHEEYPGYLLPTNRGAAYMDGMLFRGTEDGRVLAYDFKTGKRLWETTIADPAKGEAVPAAPIAWKGLVFIGNAGGDEKGGKGHMFALDAKTGKIVWEFFLVPQSEGDAVRGPLAPAPENSTWKNPPGMPIAGAGTWTSFTLDPASGLLYVPGGNPAPDYDKGVRPGDNLYSGSVVVLDAKTGAYRHHFQIVPADYHDWDVSNPPALIETRGGKKLMVVSPKNGYLYGFDRTDDKLLYKTPVTTIENADVPFSTDKDVRFCPGGGGGEEWNSPAYDRLTNLVLTGDVDWCTTVRLGSPEDVRAVPIGQWWTGEKSLDPFNVFGEFTRADGVWAGWVHAVDADSGVWKWRLKTNYPITGAVTPTAGGLVFFGDMGGNFYAVDAASGQKLWGRNLGGAIAGGVITYALDGTQYVAVAAGFISPAWPVPIRTSKVVILGVEGGKASQ